MNRRARGGLALALTLALAGALGPAPVSLRAADAAGWQSLFDGRTLDGWRAAEHPASFKVVDGTIACDGPRAHLFYTGAVGGADFKNFDFSAEVKTRPGANSGIFFHTRFQERDWPKQGFEVQVNNSQARHGNYQELKKTGSLYGVRNLHLALVPDDEWFTLRIAVRGPRVQIRLNDVLVVDYRQADQEVTLPDGPLPRLGRGTFALQCHDPASQVFYRELRVRPLPDELPDDPGPPPVVDARYRQMLSLAEANFPLIDLHGHLKGGLTLGEVLEHSRQTGINYGLAVNCGLGFPVTNDVAARAFASQFTGQPVFVALQGEGREWHRLISRETRAQFDYAFTDAMTFTDHRGQRVRLWMRDEVQVDDPQAYMELIVRQIETILTEEPIDIYVNATFLPEVLAAQYDALWTPERMDRVIRAAVTKGVAIEINARYRIPSETFIRRAKQAGVKFTFGTNNGDRNLGQLEYCLEMQRRCGLTWEDMFVPERSRRR